MLYERWLQWREREIVRSGVFIPEVSQSDYLSRDRDMKEAGLLEWERKWLVSRDFKGAGIQRLLSDRYDLKSAARGGLVGYNEYQRAISKKYGDNKWFTRDGRKNPFRLLDFTKDRDDIGETPQPKRGRRPVDFTGGKAKTLEVEKTREQSLANARAKMAKMKRY